MIYQLFFSEIGFSIRQAIRTLCGRIAAILYNFIVDLYNVFMIVARAEILDNKYIQAIYNRVGMILGIFMLFKLTFSLIQSLVDPNKFTDEKKGFAGIIKRSVIAIVLLGITPSLFDMAFDIQELIVGTENSSNNIIYKFIVADTEYESADSFGKTIAADLFFSFYKENETYKLDEGVSISYPEGEGITIDVNNYTTLIRKIKSGEKDFGDTVDYLTLTEHGEYVIEWNEIFSIGMAIAVIWILITYTIQVATRVVQLAYLQLIAPVPILSYIGDPEGTFKNWTKQCTTTYLDLFLRLAIIYFIIALSGKILNIFSEGGEVLLESTGLKPEDSATTWVKLFLIIGLLMFGKRVPDLLKDLFPNMGGGAASLGFGIKSPMNTLRDIPYVGNTAAKVVGWTGKKAAQFAGLPFKGLGMAGKYGWNRWVKQPWQQHKDYRKGYKEENEKDKSSASVWKDYGNDFEKGNLDRVFDNNREYINSYNNLAQAKKSLGESEKYGTNSQEYAKAKREFDKAKANHDINRNKYGKLAKREDELKRYKDRHPEQFDSSSNSSSSNNSTTNVNMDRLQEIARRQAANRPSSFTEAERRAEAERRENMRSSYNNAHEDELARQSIFNDNAAMRESDMNYNTGVSKPNASLGGAPTAENSIFNDDIAMRESDAEYMRQNSDYEDNSSDSWASQGRADSSDNW